MPWLCPWLLPCSWKRQSPTKFTANPIAPTYLGNQSINQLDEVELHQVHRQPHRSNVPRQSIYQSTRRSRAPPGSPPTPSLQRIQAINQTIYQSTRRSRAPTGLPPTRAPTYLGNQSNNLSVNQKRQSSTRFTVNPIAPTYLGNQSNNQSINQKSQSPTRFTTNSIGPTQLVAWAQ